MGLTPITEDAVDWEPDPLVFIYKYDIPGRVKMHTRTLDFDQNWIKIDRSYMSQMKLRHQILNDKRNEVLIYEDRESTRFAKQELLEEIGKYLPQRFPQLFQVAENGDIYNRLLQTHTSLSGSDASDPFERINQLTQEDWVIIEWSDDDQGYIATAGLVCFPMRWSLREKFMQSISSIHVPVKVFKPHLESKVYDLFRKMPTTAPVWRANWAIFNDLDGPLDLYTPIGSMTRNAVNQTTAFDPEQTGTDLTFRAEYQTLWRLPKSGAIVFGIRTYQRYLNEFKQFPAEDSADLIKAIENLDTNIVIYKGAEYWQDAALKYLEMILADKDTSFQQSSNADANDTSDDAKSTDNANKWMVPTLTAVASALAVSAIAMIYVRNR